MFETGAGAVVCTIVTLNERKLSVMLDFILFFFSLPPFNLFLLMAFPEKAAPVLRLAQSAAT